MAFLKGSFYENARRFTENDKGETPFRGVRARMLENPPPVLEHSVATRDVFAAGALRAARWLAGRPAALYTMQDVLARDA